MTEAVSDPTIQSPRAPAADETGHWNVSLAEIDAMGRKAARGAGLSWGLAEEAGRAAKTLAIYRLPGPDALLAALEAMDAIDAHAPDRDLSATAPLCPIRLGAALADRPHIVDGGRQLGAVLEPLLLIPFLCRAAADGAIEVRCEGAVLTATAAGPICETPDAFRGTAPGVEFRHAASPAAPRKPGTGPCRVSVDTWRRLERLAHHTYVPASEASRKGAGAGKDD